MGRIRRCSGGGDAMVNLLGDKMINTIETEIDIIVFTPESDFYDEWLEPEETINGDLEAY
jgi:hypothetical protein